VAVEHPRLETVPGWLVPEWNEFDERLAQPEPFELPTSRVGMRVLLMAWPERV